MNEQWPESLEAAIRDCVGSQPDVMPLGGMSGSNVFRLSSNGRTAIMKRSDNGREWHVYTRLAHVLAEAGVQIPELYGAQAGNGQWWLLIEDIPGKIAPEDWLVNSDIIQTLRALHQIPVERLDLYEDHYVPAWPETLSRQALTLFSPDAASRVAELLETVRQSSQGLFEPRRPVSADPNPSNWGVRTDGTPVLFDWERFTLGTPALDLAIIVPGLGDMHAYRAVSIAYAGDDRLATRITNGKIWSVVEFLAGCAEGRTEPAFDLAPLVDAVPAWLASVTS